jgi:hypothetical protein
MPAKLENNNFGRYSLNMANYFLAINARIAQIIKHVMNMIAKI